MSEVVPEGWQMSILGDICDVAGGGTPERSNKEFWGGSIPWLSPTEVTRLRTRYISKTKEYITEEGLRRSSAKIHPVGTVLMTSRASIAFPAINLVPMTTNQGFQSLKCGDMIDNEFLYQSILFNRHKLERLAAGSTFLEISSTSTRKVKLLTPPLPEQQKIASILTSVDEVIGKTETQISKLQDLKKGMMQELLTKGIGHTEFKDSPVGRIPVGWGVGLLSECCDLMTNGFVGATRDIYVIRGIPYVLCQNVRPNQFIDSVYKYVGQDFHLKNKRSVLKEGDVLTVQTGAGNGDTCVVPKKYEGANCHALIISRPKKQMLNPFFLSEYMNSDSGRTRISIIATGGAHPHVNTTDLRNENIPLPPIEEQNNIIDAVESVAIKIRRKVKLLDSYQNMKKALMQDLLTGKVRVKVN
jgi:type I restriction enzyme S subunit